MPQLRIEQLDDSRLAIYRDLPQANLTEPSGLFVVEGWLLVRRLLASSCRVHSILLEETRLEAWGAELPVDVPVYVVPAGLIDQVIGFRFHRGVLACGYRPAAPSLEMLLPVGEAPTTLVACLDIQDPTNLGSILRNAAAFGAAGVLLNRHCADPYSRRVLRVSMGTVFKLCVVRSQQIAADLVHLRDDHQVELAAAVLDDQAEALPNANRSARLALLFGNEGHGLDEPTLQLCTRRITLPMSGGVDSLNAAVASGVFLYHFTRTVHHGA